MNLVRNYKIASINNHALIGAEARLIEYLEEKYFKDLVIEYTDNYVYYRQKDILNFKYEIKKNWVRCKPIEYTFVRYLFQTFEILEEEHIPSKQDVCNLLKYMLEKKYNIECDVFFTHYL